jgi:alkylation response protein AidB-like acyl-CoA dehydrogenase
MKELLFMALAFAVAVLLIKALRDLGVAYAGSRRPKLGDSPAGDEAAQIERLERLEARVEVLERIVTDEQYELRKRFKSL